MSEQEPDLEGLRSFADSKDGEDSPIFVGREREIAHVARQAELTAQAHAEGRNTQGGTLVITGCPGSGKSAFLAHFARRFGTEELTGSVLVPVQCSHLDLTASRTEALEAQLAGFAVERKRGLHRAWQAILEDAGEALELPSTLRRLEQKIAEDSVKGTVVCLLVDEIQGLTEESARAVQLLHTRSFSPPVLPVYAGLDDAVERLKTVGGISRLSAHGHMRMGEIGTEATREAAGRLFDRYRVRGDAKARATWARAIAAEAMGFAQHLHRALQAACRVLIASGGTAHEDEALEVRRQAGAAREEFYEATMTGIVEEHAHTVLDVAHRATSAPGRVTKGQLAKWAMESMERRGSPMAEPIGREARRLIERMRHEGILHLGGTGRAEVPVPSLHAWLTGGYADGIGYGHTASELVKPALEAESAARETAGGMGDAGQWYGRRALPNNRARWEWATQPSDLRCCESIGVVVAGRRADMALRIGGKWGAGSRS